MLYLCVSPLMRPSESRQIFTGWVTYPNQSHDHNSLPWNIDLSELSSHISANAAQTEVGLTWPVKVGSVGSCCILSGSSLPVIVLLGCVYVSYEIKEVSLSKMRKRTLPFMGNWTSSSVCFIAQILCWTLSIFWVVYILTLSDTRHQEEAVSESLSFPISLSLFYFPNSSPFIIYSCYSFVNFLFSSFLSNSSSSPLSLVLPFYLHLLFLLISYSSFAYWQLHLLIYIPQQNRLV
jgi:hypothetical protein